MMMLKIKAGTNLVGNLSIKMVHTMIREVKEAGKVLKKAHTKPQGCMIH